MSREDTPQMQRKQMDNWLVKRGVSPTLICSSIWATITLFKKVTCFATVDRRSQGTSSILFVLEQLIDQIKTDLPNLATLYARSDYVGWDASIAVIMSHHATCADADICAKTSFNELQRGNSLS